MSISDLRFIYKNVYIDGRMELTASQLAALVGGTVDGDASVKIHTYSKIEEAREGSLSFLANPKYTHFVYQTKASALLVRKDFVAEHPVKATLIRVDDPYATLARLLDMASAEDTEEGVEALSFVSDGVELPEDLYLGAFSYVGKGVKLGKNVKIYPQCYVGDDVEIGAGSILYPGVKIYKGCRIGGNCILHSGVVVGGDGFGFAPENGRYRKIPQIGNVVIEDDVEIGANTTIDRAVMGSTIIRKGVKLDNLIQIAHNVEVGENTVMAAQSGVAGSVKMGRHNMVGGQVGFAGHITVGDNNQFGAQSGVHGNIGDGNVLLGTPTVDAKAFMRQSVYMKRLGEMYDELRRLSKALEDLENKQK